MICINLYRNHNTHIYGFDAHNHGDTYVCAAVSILVLNTINSIETFTDEPFTCEDEAKTGTIHFRLPGVQAGKSQPEVNLLLEAMCLGLRGIMQEYPKDLRLKESVCVHES